MKRGEYRLSVWLSLLLIEAHLDAKDPESAMRVLKGMQAELGKVPSRREACLRRVLRRLPNQHRRSIERGVQAGIDLVAGAGYIMPPEPNMKRLTPEHAAAMRKVMNGADVWDVEIARLLREVQRINRALIEIGRPRAREYSGVGAMPYFGARLTMLGNLWVEGKWKS